MAAIAAFTLKPIDNTRLSFVGSDHAANVLSYVTIRSPQTYSPEAVPSQAKLTSSHRTLPEFLSISARLAVCPEARELIERLEPGLHQFFPIAIRRKQGNKPILRRDGSELSTPYYLVNIRSRFDAILVERSDVIFISGTKNNPDGVALKYKGEHGVVLRRDMVTGHHLWQGIYQAPGYFFISDILANEIMERKWKGWDVTLLREE